MNSIYFWNGNKSSIRQSYELQLFERVLQATDSEYSEAKVLDDRTDYPKAEDEGAIFTKGIDVCVTVAGNPKFKSGNYIPVYYPLMSGLLGHRLLIIREASQPEFAAIRTADELRGKMLGIPATWADANLFRSNQFMVSEKGSLDDLFMRLKNGECDYVALGVNEIEDIYHHLAKPVGGLVLEQSLRLYYPFALVFYVHPQRQDLARQLANGLDNLVHNGELERLFKQNFSGYLERAQLQHRVEIRLENEQLPEPLAKAMVRAYSLLMHHD